MAGTAHADTIYGTYGAKIVERSHAVRVSLHGRQVQYRVRRSFRNTGAMADELELIMNLPTAAVATGLRVRMAGRWYRGALANRDEAAASYRWLIGSGPLRRIGPALMSWSTMGTLRLKLFPLRAGETVTVEYDLVARACYSDGYLLADYPVTARPVGLVRPSYRVRGGVVVDSKGLSKRLGYGDLSEACKQVGVGSPAGDVRYVVFKRPRRRTVSARLGRYRVDANHYIVSYDLDIARVLLQRPKRAHVVFVVDASRSVGLTNIRGQLALIRGYTHHLADARYEVVLYRRFAQRLFGRFLDARRARARLATVANGAIKPGNGSNLERGIGAATGLLRGVVGPQRIIAFTDSRLRRAFRPRMVVTRSLGTRALIHYVDVALSRRGQLSLEREETHQLASAAAATGGIVAAVSGNARDRKRARSVMLELVRPDHVYGLVVDGVDDMALNKPQSYRRGRGLRGLYISKRRVTSMGVHGKIWGRSVDFQVAANRRDSRSLPRLVFGDESYASLPAEKLEAVARAGGVVSPRTSLLVTDPTMRPTSVNLLRGVSTRSSTYSSHCGGPHGLSGHGSYLPGKPRQKPAYAAILRSQLRERNAGCDLLHSRAKNALIHVTVETTGREIVDVGVTGGAPRLRRCMAEAAWQLRLDDAFREKRGRYRFDYVTAFGR